MNATYNNLPRQRVDKVTKKVVVVAEGVRKRRVEWILVDSRGSNRRRSPTSTLMVQLSLPIPPNAIPGSEEVCGGLKDSAVYPAACIISKLHIVAVYGTHVLVFCHSSLMMLAKW